MAAPELGSHRPGRGWSAAAVLGGLVTFGFVAIALVALVWTPYGTAPVPGAALRAPPSAAHLLGTDPFGRDVLSLLMAGTQASALVAIGAVGLGAGLGIPLGLAAAARGGLVDEALMRGGDLVFAFPSLISAAMLAAVYGPGATTAAIAIGLFNAPVFARLTRGAAAVVWRSEFVLAARAAGRTSPAISAVHVLPNIAGVLIVQATIQLALAVLAEAALSYVGLGVRPPHPSWGRMLAESQTMIFVAPHLVLAPGLTIALAVLGLNLFGDGLRDRLDPRAAVHG